jgi:hypothetical protein
VSRAPYELSAARNCTKDEGGPFEFGDQESISSQRCLVDFAKRIAGLASRTATCGLLEIGRRGNRECSFELRRATGRQRVLRGTKIGLPGGAARAEECGREAHVAGSPAPVGAATAVGRSGAPPSADKIALTNATVKSRPLGRKSDTHRIIGRRVQSKSEINLVHTLGCRSGRALGDLLIAFHLNEKVTVDGSPRKQ